MGQRETAPASTGVNARPPLNICPLPLKGHTKPSLQFKDWQTPWPFFAEKHEQYHFTLDVAASHENTLLSRYCTPEGKFDLNASGFEGPLGSIISKAHGLDPEAWRDERVFCNPPYDNTLPDWLEIAASGVAEMGFVLLPPSVDTKWFWKYLWQEANFTRLGPRQMSRAGVDVHFYEGRLRFYRPDLDHPGYIILGAAPRAGNMWSIFQRHG